MMKAKFIAYGNIRIYGNTTHGMKEAIKTRLTEVYRDATKVTVTKIDIIDDDKQ